MANKYVSLRSIPLDSSLYHYTKCNGVQGILKEQAFRATKSDFLNDTNEMQYILSVVSEVLREIRKEKWRELLQNQFPNTFYELKKRSYYIVSFSTDPDSITLWAEFGDNTGYNLEFQSSELIQEIELTKKISYHGYVIYSAKEQRKIIRDLLLYDIPRSFGYSFEDIMERAVSDKNYPLFQKYCNSFQKALTIYALFFKQEEFSAEKEYRMVFKANTKHEIFYREKDGFLLPYITVKLVQSKRNIPLQSITVAPKNHVDLAREGMRQYSKHLGYDVEIRLSKIKLRY
ncbi:MAG: DUF2971 domain-containing protein [Lachnospiraceae bacterium]